MIKRIIYIIIGVVIISVVIVSGYLSADSSFTSTLIFGLLCTFIAPSGINWIKSGIRKDKIILEKLSKVPDISRLIAEAESHETKIENLKKFENQIQNIIRYEVTKKTALDKQKYLESEAKKIITEWKEIDNQLIELEGNIDKIKERLDESEYIKELYIRLSANRDGKEVIKLFGQYFSIDINELYGMLPFGNL